jgi:hypothetical protein
VNLIGSVMTAYGQIRNGTIVLKTPLGLPDGAEVELEVKEVRSDERPAKRRDIARLAEGINYDFDALERLREASKL